MTFLYVVINVKDITLLKGMLSPKIEGVVHQNDEIISFVSHSLQVFVSVKS